MAVPLVCVRRKCNNVYVHAISQWVLADGNFGRYSLTLSQRAELLSICATGAARRRSVAYALYPRATAEFDSIVIIMI